jgi:RND family efflux transporter MFP subunit
MLALAEARNQAIAAAEQYQQTLASRRLHLVTNAQLLAARQAQELAQLKLNHLLSQGVGGSRYIKSNRSGVINHIYAAPGQITASGSPLLQIVSSHRIEIRIGVEPTDIPLLHNGMPVNIDPIGAGARAVVPGAVSLITLRVNPATRLVDVFVTPRSSSGLLLGEYVRASITIATLKGLVAPRAAVLPDGRYQNLFTVYGGVAHLRHVRIIRRKPHEYLIAAPGLAVGDRIVVEGNPQLKNLMAVTETFRP